MGRQALRLFSFIRLGCQKVVFKISIVNLHNHAERLFRLFPAIRISKCSELHIEN